MVNPKKIIIPELTETTPADTTAARTITAPKGTGKSYRKSDKNIIVSTNALTGQIATARGTFNKVKVRNKDNSQQTPEIEDLLKHNPRAGFHLAPDDDIFIYECVLHWYSKQCISTDPKNPDFLVNETTGGRGDIVIGHIQDGKTVIPWKKLANEFYTIKGQCVKGNSKKALAKRDEQTQNFKRMVNALVTSPRKRFAAPPRLEKNKYGDTVFVEDFVQPLTIQLKTCSTGKHIILRLDDYFIPKNGEAWTKYKPIPAALMSAIQENANSAVQDAILLLRTLFRQYLGEGKNKMKVDKEKTAEINEKRKAEGKTPAIIVRRDLFLKTLITTTSGSDIAGRRHKHAHDVFKKAFEECGKSGVASLYASENDDFNEWWTTGNLPKKYKTWGKFYEKTKVALYIIKES